MFAWPDVGVLDACLEASADFGYIDLLGRSDSCKGQIDQVGRRF